jgi:hypothetical protein
MDALNRLARLVYLLGLVGSLGLIVYFAALMVGLKASSNGFWP